MSAARLRDFPSRSNSLNAIRLLLAVLVIVAHAWPISGHGEAPEWEGTNLGDFGVTGFFAISGWLITASRLSSSLPSYGWRRFLRIYPGYLVAVLVVAFVAAPVGSALGAGEYGLRDGAHYVAANITMFIGDRTVGATPGDAPYPVWNASLWTLFHEAACYALVGLALTFVGRRWFAPTVVLGFLALSGLHVVQVTAGLPVPGTAIDFLGLAPFFFAGATLFLVRDRMPLGWPLAAGAGVWLLAVFALGVPLVLAALPVAYLMLWLGAVLPFHAIGRRNDISYGMYIYAFPVQQLLYLIGGDGWPLPVFVVLSIAATVPFAAFSWLAVERPAQRFRRAADSFPLVRSGARVVRRPSLR